MTPIKTGTARRLGLRKPTGVYRYRDGTVVWLDEATEWIQSVLGERFKLAPFQRRYLNEMMRADTL